MSFWFSKEDIIYLHSTIVMKAGGEDEEAIREFLGLAAGKIGYDSFANWVRSKIDYGL